MYDIIKFNYKNLTIYKLSSIQAIAIFNGFGICDDCCIYANIGYYVPVLNHYHYLCEKCLQII